MIEKLSNSAKFAWRTWPLVERKGKTFLMLIAMLSFIAITWHLVKSEAFTVLVAVIFLYELRRFILPTSFTLNNESIIQKTLFAQKIYVWSDFKMALQDKNGFLLSPYNKRSILEKFKGLYILLGVHTPTGVESFIKDMY